MTSPTAHRNLILLLALSVPSALAGCGSSEPALDAPRNVVASNGTYNDKVVIAWDAVAGASHYSVFRSDTSDGPYAQLGADVSSTSAEDATGTPGVAYDYKVRASRAAGAEGPWSDSAVGQRGTFPNPPASVSASQGTYSTKIVVQWSAVAGADHYLVFRSASSSGAFTDSIASTASTQCENTASDPAYAISGDAHYFYKVKAVDSGGESAFSASAEGFAGTGTPTLSAPTGVQASDRANSTSVAVRWDAVAGAASYRVFRSLQAEGDYAPISDALAAPATTFEDDGAFEDTAYWYRVKAYDAAGESAFSAAAPGRRDLTPLEYLLRFNLEWDRMYRKLSEQSGWPPSGETNFSFAGDAAGSEKVGINVPFSLPLKAVTTFTHSGYSDHGMVFSGSETMTIAATTTVKDQDGTCTGVVTTGGTYSGTVTDNLQIDGALRVPAVGSKTSTFTAVYKGATETVDFAHTRALRNGAYHLLLSSPHQVAASQGATSGAVEVTWAPVYSADKYQVLRSPTAGGDFSLLGETPGSWISADGTVYRFTDATAASGTHYFYEVVAANTTVCNDLNANKKHDTSNPDETVLSDPSPAVEGWAQ